METLLVTLTLVRLENGQVRMACVEPGPALKAEFNGSAEARLLYIQGLMLHAARLPVTAEPIVAPRPVPPCIPSRGERRELDEWVCACGCGRRWPIDEERPA